jgi:hypothetical protein
MPRTMPKVFRLAYLDVGSSDTARDRSFYMDVMGLREVGAGEGRSYLSVGYDHHNLCFRSGAEGVRAMGYQLKRGITLDDIAALLGDKGFKTQRLSDARPGIASLVECEPFPGHVLQFFEDMEAPAPGFASHGVEPLRLGHLGLRSPAEWG